MRGETKHTPGPWCAAGCTVYTQNRVTHWLQPRDAQCRMVAAVACNGDSGGLNWPGEDDEKANAPDMEEAVANARLIAAAPELLEALRAIVALAADHGRMNLPECAGLARAAIAKATVED